MVSGSAALRHREPLGLIHYKEASKRARHDDFRASLELVKVIRPLLHHLAPLRQMRSAVVGAPVRVTAGVSKLVLDVIRGDVLCYQPRCRLLRRLSTSISPRIRLCFFAALHRFN